jgi:hypothetical protein
MVLNELEAAHQFVSHAKYFAARSRMSRSASSSRIRALMRNLLAQVGSGAGLVSPGWAGSSPW